MDWTDILLVIFGVATAALGITWARTKRVVKELAELLVSVSDAIADDKVTRAELKTIAQEAKELIAAVKALVGK